MSEGFVSAKEQEPFMEVTQMGVKSRIYPELGYIYGY